MKSVPAERRATASAPWSLPPVLAEQALVGAVTALVATVAEVIAGIVRPGSETDAGTVAVGAAHLAAMYLPFGVGAGLAVGLVLGVIRATPWMDPLRWRLADRRRFFAPAPEAFSTGTGLVAAALFLFVTSARAVTHFTTRYHDQALATWAYAAVGLALVGLSAVVVMGVAALVRPVARRVGRAASLGILSAVLLAAVGVVIAVVLSRFTQILRAYDPVDLAWMPGAVLAYVLLAFGTRRLFRRRPQRLRFVHLAMLAAALLAILWSGAAYGEENRVRGWVEHQSVAGQRLVRFWRGLTDRDRDGHSFAFGGADCDDTDADVFPGALDESGDGVDADCFDGDGTSADVADMGDGRYGSRPEGLDRPNFLVISVDALRPDHLGCFGYERETSPHLDAFCEQAVRFEDVTAQSSRSIRSFPAMWTGLYPSQVAFGDEYLYPSLLEENTTVAEVLSEAGWDTAMVMGTNYFARTGHFFQGFDRVEQDDLYKPPRERPVERGMRHLDRMAQGDEPWLLWVHLFNVHLEYLWDGTPSRFGDEAVDEYDTEVLLADEQVGRMLEALAASGEADETVVVVLSDHGESFGEHGNQGHSTTLYQEELSSVLLLRVPGVEPRAVEQPVGLFDLAPTVTNLAGLPAPHPMPARSLVPLMTDGDAQWPSERLLFAELMPDGMFPFDQKAVRRGHTKLVWWVRDGTVQLFDLAADPTEQNDLSDEREDETRSMLGLMRAWIAGTHRPDNRSRDVVAENRLEAVPTDMTHRLDLRFPGMFRVLGFDLPETRFRPGERIPMTFYYEVDGPTDRDLFFYVDIEGPPGYAHVHDFHAHHYPLNGHYRTYQWRAGEILRDPVEMVIPHDIRRPVDMKITLRVLENRRPVTFLVDGREETKLHLADLEIR